MLEKQVNKFQFYHLREKTFSVFWCSINRTSVACSGLAFFVATMKSFEKKICSAITPKRLNSFCELLFSEFKKIAFKRVDREVSARSLAYDPFYRSFPIDPSCRLEPVTRRAAHCTACSVAGAGTGAKGRVYQVVASWRQKLCHIEFM